MDLDLPPIVLTPQQEEERYLMIRPGTTVHYHYNAERILSGMPDIPIENPRLLEFLQHSYPGDWVEIGRVTVIHLRRNWDQT